MTPPSFYSDPVRPSSGHGPSAATTTAQPPVPPPPAQAVVSSATSERLVRLVAENNAVAEELSLPSLYRRVVEAAHELVPSAAAALAVLTSEGVVGQVFQIFRDEEHASCLPLESPVLDELTGTVGVLEPDRITRLASLRSASPAWSRGLVATAVPYRHKVLAVLLVADEGPGLTAEDESVLLTLATASGTAMEKALLYEEARLRQEWIQEAAELGSGNEAMAVEDEAIQLMAQSAFRLADAELVAAWVPGCSPDLFDVDAAFGAGDDEVADHPLRSDDPLVVQALGQAVRLGPAGMDALASSSDWARYLLGLGLRTVVVLPITAGGEPRGLLLLGRHRGRPPFSPLELDLAEDFVRRAATAMDRISAQVVEQRLTLLEDRERIARDLHDHIIQRLFATGLTLQSLGSTMRDDRSRRKLGSAVAEIDNTIRQLRTSIFQLSLDDGPGAGLRAAVLEVLRQLTPVLGFEPAFDVVGPVDTVTAGELQEQVVAVVREAVTNAAKHSRATAVGVTLRTDGLSLGLDVVDNGVGLGDSTRRSGLSNLRHRARRLGGSLQVVAPETGGTGLMWTVPLPS